MEKFYGKPYSQRNSVPKDIRSENIINVGPEEQPDNTTEEIQLELFQMKNEKAPGKDEISVEMKKFRGNITIKFIKCF